MTEKRRYELESPQFISCQISQCKEQVDRLKRELAKAEEHLTRLENRRKNNRHLFLVK